MPEGDPTNPGGVCYRYDTDIGPGEVRQRKGTGKLKGSVVRVLSPRPWPGPVFAGSGFAGNGLPTQLRTSREC